MAFSQSDSQIKDPPVTDTVTTFTLNPDPPVNTSPEFGSTSNVQPETPINSSAKKNFIIPTFILLIITLIGLSIYIFKNKQDNQGSNPYPQISRPTPTSDTSTPTTKDTQPTAWFGEAHSGKIGQPITFNASGSYDPSGNEILLYEWDFDGDGIYDLATKTETATHTYDFDFNDYVTLRVTGTNGTAIARARTVVNQQGYASQGDEDPCELDENGYSIITGPDGNFLNCTADHLPTRDKEGVYITQ